MNKIDPLKPIAITTKQLDENRISKIVPIKVISFTDDYIFGEYTIRGTDFVGKWSAQTGKSLTGQSGYSIYNYEIPKRIPLERSDCGSFFFLRTHNGTDYVPQAIFDNGFRMGSNEPIVTFAELAEPYLNLTDYPAPFYTPNMYRIVKVSSMLKDKVIEPWKLSNSIQKKEEIETEETED